MSLLTTLLSTLAACWIGLALFAALMADRMIFPAPSASYSFAEPYFHLRTDEGLSLPALYFFNTQTAPVLLYSHGNGEDLGRIRPLLQEYHRRGWNVLAYEYPGYGTAAGPASETRCYQAIDAAYQWLTQAQNYAPEQIFLYGRSLGSGPSVDLASRKPVAGLILEGAFLSTFKVITRVQLLWWDRFSNDAKLAQLNVPLLSIHGKKDRTVPFWHGQKLYQLAPGPKHHFWSDNAGHNDLIDIGGETYWDALQTFCSTYYTGSVQPTDSDLTTSIPST